MNLADMLGALLRELGPQVRGYAKEAGTACSIDGAAPCDALTVGVRCEKCLRRVCPKHTFWSIVSVSKKPVPYCPYCVLRLFPEIFPHDDDDADRDTSGQARKSDDNDDVLDAEIVD